MTGSYDETQNCSVWVQVVVHQKRQSTTRRQTSSSTSFGANAAAIKKKHIEMTYKCNLQLDLLMFSVLIFSTFFYHVLWLSWKKQHVPSITKISLR